MKESAFETETHRSEPLNYHVSEYDIHCHSNLILLSISSVLVVPTKLQSSNTCSHVMEHCCTNTLAHYGTIRTNKLTKEC